MTNIDEILRGTKRRNLGYPSESIFDSRREDDWQEEQERKREEDFRRIADNVQIQWDIFKGSTQAHVGLAQVYTSAGLHPIAKLELLKMGIRP